MLPESVGPHDIHDRPHHSMPDSDMYPNNPPTLGSSPPDEYGFQVNEGEII